MSAYLRLLREERKLKQQECKDGRYDAPNTKVGSPPTRNCFMSSIPCDAMHSNNKFSYIQRAIDRMETH